MNKLVALSALMVLAKFINANPTVQLDPIVEYIKEECNCNDHSDSCRLNKVLHRDQLESGIQGSGNLCDYCQHFTWGIHCDFCVYKHYRDPALPLNDKDMYRKCDCDPIGTYDDGLCDPYTNPDDGMVAGRCRCRKFTDGSRCEKCKNGYWNFTAENPDGCQPCDCDILGAYDNNCDAITGQCRCRSNFEGQKCVNDLINIEMNSSK